MLPDILNSLVSALFYFLTEQPIANFRVWRISEKFNHVNEFLLANEILLVLLNFSQFLKKKNAPGCATKLCNPFQSDSKEEKLQPSIWLCQK